jgi:hypothetical protein
MIAFIILTGNLLRSDHPIAPYFDIEGNFRFNYTGACVEGVPNVAFTSTADSLDIDSLLGIYPTVITMTDEAFTAFIEEQIEAQDTLDTD